MKRLMASLALFAALALPAGASAATPEFFAQFPESSELGSGPDQFLIPNAIAASPLSHDIFVSDKLNLRINEFTAWGGFVKSFGWGVRNGAPELQSCTQATDCRAGLAGEGDGEFAQVPASSEYQGPSGLAVDSSGDLFAMDLGNFRVQKFDPEGRFLLAFGGEVNKTKVEKREEEEANSEPVTVSAAEENVCTAASGDRCGAGVLGTGPGAFSIENVAGVDHDSLATGPDGLIYTGDRNRIQAFQPDGQFDHSLPLPKAGNPGGLAVDPLSGDIYFIYNQENHLEPTIYRLNSDTGAVQDEITPEVGSVSVDTPEGLATDPAGNLYVADYPGSENGENQRSRVLRYSAAGTFVDSFDRVPVGEGAVTERAIDTGMVGGSPDRLDIYVGHNLFFGSPGDPGNLARIKIFGSVPDPAVVGPPPKLAPTITDQYATSVGTTEATLRAAINPHFWTTTTYYLQYGTDKCSEGGCTTEAPLPPGSRLTSRIVGESLAASAIPLPGLQPGTTYHYRFVARTVFGSGEEAEVRGVGGEVGHDGAEATFTTYPSTLPPDTSCPNQSLRAGPAALLPDCRAYELVSPLDKNGADIATLPNVTGFPAGLDQANPDGEALTYTAYRAFGDSVSGPYGVQYLAERGPEGWSSRSLSPPREGGTFLSTPLLEREYRAFSPDLSEGWLYRETNPLLDPAAPAGWANLYRRAPSGGYEALVTAEPAAPADPHTFIPQVQGTGGDCTVFRANGKLTGQASAAGGYQLYESCGGEISLVSITPSGATAEAASAGTGNADSDHDASLHNAVSRDGQEIFWSNAGDTAGKLFARLGGSETIALSKGTVQFLTAADDGSKAIYAEGGQLLEFTLGENLGGEGTLIAKGFIGFLAASEDASRIYFLSTQELAAGATPGKPNLYLYEAGAEGGPGTFTYIAALAAADLETYVSPVKLSPVRHVAQATPDGGALVFDSVGRPTGFDNTDQRTGEADLEVYIYRAATGRLTCVSCAASGARPAGRVLKFNLSGGAEPQPTAATIPISESSLYTPRAISTDGRRAFFTSYVPLSLRDTNGTADAYEWEEAGEGDCSASSPGYDPAWEGCVELLSSGQSPVDSELVDSGADGHDAFFATTASLIAADPGLRDIYDARIGGGFPVPAPTAACEGEACQGPYSPPNDPTPSSSAFEGPGNVRKAKAKHKQRKKKSKQHRKKHKQHKKKKGSGK